MNTETRVRLSDTPLDFMGKIAEGNPGALTVCMRMFTEGAAIDPQDFMGGLGAVMALDTHGVYGPRVWMLYKDVCGENLENTLSVLRACQLGKLSESAMMHAIDNYGEGIDVDELNKIVKEELEQFGRQESP